MEEHAGEPHGRTGRRASFGTEHDKVQKIYWYPQKRKKVMIKRFDIITYLF